MPRTPRPSATTRWLRSTARDRHREARPPNRERHGDTITYSFIVSLKPGSQDLSNIVVTDPLCDPVTLTGPISGDGDDGDGILDRGETWHFSCTHVVSFSDLDPLPNTSIVSGNDVGGAFVCDRDNHLADIA